MKYIYIIGILLICAFCHAQEYFSKIIPTVDNPLVEKVKKVGDQYIISTDFFSFDGVQGGLIIVSDQDDEKVKFDNMDLGLSPILINENSIFLVGENPLNEGDSILFLSKLDANLQDIEWYNEYSLPVQRTVNSAIRKVGDNIFILNVNNAGIDFMYQRELVIIKTNTVGNLLNVSYYNRDKRTTYGYELFPSFDSNLVISSIYSRNDILGTYSQVLKINDQGEIIWNYEGAERLDNGAVPTWAIELSDSTILQTYYVDRNSDAEYIANNWFPRPNKFIWLSKDGELIKDKTVITDKQDFLLYYGLKTGDEDYFYAYGYLESLDPDPGLKYSCHLTKFSNIGDTLWTHNYRHPLYQDNNILYNIKDIIEEDNGDITILADITPQTGKTEVWLFKVNSEGCYVNDECEDMTVITSTEDPISNHQKIYPNPTSGMIHLEWHTKIKEIRLTDITGKIIKKINVGSKSYDFNLLGVEEGIYILQILDEFNKTTNSKIIKK